VDVGGRKLQIEIEAGGMGGQRYSPPSIAI